MTEDVNEVDEGFTPEVFLELLAGLVAQNGGELRVYVESLQKIEGKSVQIEYDVAADMYLIRLVEPDGE